MSKKSLRAAIDLHKRLTDGCYQDGSYNGATGDDRKPVFKKALLIIEPVLICCPFCNELPVFSPSSLRGGGACANYYGSVASIECDNCDLLFKGHYGEDICKQWNSRLDNKEQ